MSDTAGQDGKILESVRKHQRWVALQPGVLVRTVSNCVSRSIRVSKKMSEEAVSGGVRKQASQREHDRRLQFEHAQFRVGDLHEQMGEYTGHE